MAEGVGEGAAVRVPGAPVALSTASVYPQACADAFVFAADLGYDGIEVMVWTDPVSQDIGSLRGLVDHYQVPVLAIHAPTLLGGRSGSGAASPGRSCAARAGWRSISGPGTVVVHPPFRWQRDYAAAFVDGVERLADEFGVRLRCGEHVPVACSGPGAAGLPARVGSRP